MRSSSDDSAESRWKAVAIRFVREWGLILVVGAGLYLTGWHTEVIGRIQQALLHTGILNPKVDERSAEASAENAGNWPDAGRMIVESLDGEVVHLSELRGQVVFINFWATWCPPCIAELPSIERLAEDASLREGASGSAPIAFMLVSLDEDRAAVEAFVRRKEITLPVYMLRMKDREPMDVSRIPSTYVVTADGRIAYSRSGLANYDTRRFKAFLKELAKQPASSGPEPASGPERVSGLEPASGPEP